MLHMTFITKLIMNNNFSLFFNLLQEIIFAIAVILSYFGTGISCAVYAAGWGTNCSGGPDSDANPCNSLVATMALAAVCCVCACNHC